MKKWAFVSDYARFWILYNYGGLYFDTDVEMIKGIEDIVESGPFMGIECATQSAKSFASVNPGLGLGADAGNEMYKKILQKYELYSEDDNENTPGVNTTENVVTITTAILKDFGFIEIYPSDYFCPMDYKTGMLLITNRTRTIHHYSATWLGGLDRIIVRIEDYAAEKNKVIKTGCSLVLIPIKIINIINKVGIKKTFVMLRKKMRG